MTFDQRERERDNAIIKRFINSINLFLSKEHIIRVHQVLALNQLQRQL